MIYVLRPLVWKDAATAEAPEPDLPLPRVAALPGADRRILRKRLERPRKADRTRRRPPRRAAG